MLIRIIIVSIVFVIVFIQGSCTRTNSLEELVPPIVGISDQGVVRFRDDGNIEVIFNNLHMKNNPVFSELSYIGVWVYDRGANIRSRCCVKKSSDGLCSSEEQNACIKGVGFSNDLAYAGSFYLDVNPPQPFNPESDRYYMVVHTSDKQGIPANYQGEYQTFSSPVNFVEDRSRYDLYIGVFFSILGEKGKLRPINQKRSYLNKDVYAAVSPDLISPPIPIEAKFFREFEEDQTGSVYSIPNMAGWQSGINDGPVDPRINLRISEIGNSISSVTENDYIEIYNPTDEDMSLEDVYIQRFTQSRCSTIGTQSSLMSLYDKVIYKNSYMVVTRSGQSLSLPAGFPSDSLKEYSSSGSFNAGDDHCFALTLGKEPLVDEEGEEGGTDPSAQGGLIWQQGYEEYLNNAAVYKTDDNHVIDFVGYGSVGNFEGSASAPPMTGGNQAISRCGPANDTNDNQADFSIRPPTPGDENDCP